MNDVLFLLFYLTIETVQYLQYDDKDNIGI